MRSTTPTGHAARLATIAVATAAMAWTPAAWCQTSRPSQPPATQPSSPGVEPTDAAGVGHLVRRLELAHGQTAWREVAVVRADLHVRFGNADLIRGLLRYDTRGGRVRIDLADGTILVYDGSSAWVSPSSAETPMARFHLLTWPYFLAAPFKLRDPGVRVGANGLLPLGGKLCETMRLTFAPGIGDTPDDWYVVYVDPTELRVAAMAYIVTYGTPAAEARNDPHAIIYDGYSRIRGVMLSTRWRFRSWSPDGGMGEDDLGSASLRNVGFEDLDETLFRKPADAREDKLGGSDGATKRRSDEGGSR